MTKVTKFVFLFVFTLLTSTAFAEAEGGYTGTEGDGTSGISVGACPNANIFTNIFDQVCWSCFLNDLNMFGVGRKPDGAASSAPMCSCPDDLGVPEIGWPLGFWSPTRVYEQVTTPWCSPGLGGIRLQNTYTGLGYVTKQKETSGQTTAFFQSHSYSFPLMQMMELLILPSCTTGYYDFDLLGITEINPMWNNDLLALILSPSAILFSSPLARIWCAEDCVSSTLNDQKETSYGCAGCDGHLYPLTGNVNPAPDQVAASSLIMQRNLAISHRAGTEVKTIGSEARCEPEYAPFIPRSQYKMSMMYPVPQASETGVLGFESTSDMDSGSFQDVLAGQSGDMDRFNECCQPMGMSTSRWCTPVGGRTRPGKDSAYLYLLWQYRDCCVR